VSEPRRSCHDRVPFPSTRFHFSELSRHVWLQVLYHKSQEPNRSLGRTGEISNVTQC
jgi:hypothetical protein